MYMKNITAIYYLTKTIEENTRCKILLFKNMLSPYL